MRRTLVMNGRVFSFDAACVYAALIDFGNYPQQWPSELRLKALSATNDLVGSRFEVRPRGRSFACEVVAFVDQRELHIRYVDGLHRGTGLWTLRPRDNGTPVCDQIDLEPQGFVPRLLSNVIDFASIHSKGMEKVLDGLQQWLSKDAQ